VYKALHCVLALYKPLLKWSAVVSHLGFKINDCNFFFKFVFEKQHQSGYNQRGCSNDGQSRNYQAGYVDHDQTYQAEYADHQGTVDYTPAESSFHPKQDREPNEQSRPQQQPSTHSSPPSAKTTGNSSQGVFRGQSHSGAGQHSRGNPGQHSRGNAGQYSRGNIHRGYGGRTSGGKEVSVKLFF